MSEPMSLIFEVYQDAKLIRTERLQQDVIKIGSHAKSHLCIDDPGVSRVHAYIEVSGDEISLIDLGSGRGTYVNGEKINKRALQHKDQIGLGQTTILFLTRDERAIAAAKAAEREKKKRAKIKDEVVYSRRFLSRPKSSDGSVEIALLFHDFVMAEEVFHPPKDVWIGMGAGGAFAIDHASLGSQNFLLVEGRDGEPVVNFLPQGEGELYIGTERFTLRQAVESGRAKMQGSHASVPLDVQTRAKLVFGDQVLFVHRTSRAPKIIGGAKFGRDSVAFLLTLLLSVGLHLAFLGLAKFWPDSGSGFGFDAFDSSNRFVQILLQDAQDEPEPDPEPEESDDDDDDDMATEGERAAGDEGRAGDEAAEEDDARMAVEGDADPSMPIELAREQAMESVQDRGALAVLNQQGPTSLFGDMASGYDPVTAIGAVSGSDIGAAYGTSGLGRYGGGLGGGGRSMGGGFGSGPIAVRGRAGGGDQRLGRDQVAVRDREVRQPTVITGTAEIRGQLDRDIIQRVVREHRREIRACYEAELQRNPDLEGRVSMAWIIAPDGTVSASRVESSSLNSNAVEECMARRIRQWRFPEPLGGGIVNVTYPFVFSPGG